MNPPLLLDSMSALRLANGDDIHSKSLDAIRTAREAGRMTLVSPVAAWELATLARLGRIRLAPSSETWFRALLELPGIALAPMPIEVLLGSAALPGHLSPDPAKRIVAATARMRGYRVLTRSAALLKYAGEGHIDAMAC